MSRQLEAEKPRIDTAAAGHSAVGGRSGRGIAALFVACAAVKLRCPAHTVMSRASWRYLFLVFVFLEAAALLLSDWTIVGVWWTIPAVVCLGCCIVFRISFWARVGDDGCAENGMIVR